MSAIKMSIDVLAGEVADELGITKLQAKEHIQVMFEVIAQNMAGGMEVNIPQFGRFSAKRRAARMGRNPKTGEAIEIPSKYVPAFMPAAALKERVDA